MANTNDPYAIGGAAPSASGDPYAIPASPQVAPTTESEFAAGKAIHGNLFQRLLAPKPAHPRYQAVPPPSKNPAIFSGRVGDPYKIDPQMAQAAAASAAETGRVSTLISQGLQYPISHTTLPLITGKKTYEEQMPVYRKKLGLEGFYNYNPPDIHTGVPLIDRPINAAQGFASGLANNVMDAAITMPIDPLTAVPYLGELKRTPLGVAAKSLANKALVNTLPGRAAIRATQFGGNAVVKRAAAEHGGDIGKAIQEMEGVQGAGHQATAEGQRWEALVKRRTNQIVNGINPHTGVKIPGAALSKTEQINVQHALNGEELPVTKVGGEEFPTALSPKEEAAVRQLHNLTELDFKMRSRAALSVALRSRISQPGLRSEVESYFRSGKEPVVPEPERPFVKRPYGKPVERTRQMPTQPGPNYDELYAQAVEGLGPKEKELFSKGLTSEEYFKQLAPDLQEKAEEIKEAISRKVTPHAHAEVKTLKPLPRYKMVPRNKAQIEHMTEVRDKYLGIVGDISKGQEGGLMRYRQKYYPFQHHGEAANRPAFSINPAEHVDTRNVERPDLKVAQAGKTITEDFASMGKNLSHQVATKSLNDSLGSLLDDPEISKLFKEEIGATGSHVDDWGKFKNIMRAVVGWPRAALIGISPGHAFNEMDMAMNTVPLERQPVFFKDAFSLAGKIFKAQVKGDDREYSRLTAEGRKYGAGVGSFAERKPFYQKVPGLAWWSKNMNNLVWSISEGIRQTYAKMLLETGEAKTPLQAGGMAEKRLIDYQYRTPIQNAARHIAPFGTYRGGIPGAVLGGVTRSLPRAAALTRITGGAMYGDKPQPGQPGWEAFTPTAEVGRLFNFVPGQKFTESGPGDFVRGSLGSPYAAALAAAQDILAPSSDPKHWAIYGQSWLPRIDKNGKPDLGFLVSSAIAGIPEAQEILEANGIGHFQWRGLLQEIQRQATRTQVTPPTPTPPPFRPSTGSDPYAVPKP